MKKKVMEAWVEALRSGYYKQTVEKLHDDKGHCCLGVLCELAMVEGVCDFGPSNEHENEFVFDGEAGLLPERVRHWAGIDQEDGTFRSIEGKRYTLTSLNDNGKNFEQIADIIEKNWEKL
jgi:hypothetical protein